MLHWLLVRKVQRNVGFYSEESHQIRMCDRKRKPVQNKLLQSGININIIESDTTWYSNYSIPFMRDKLKHHDIIAADDTGKGFQRQGCIGIWSINTVRKLDSELAEK